MDEPVSYYIVKRLLYRDVVVQGNPRVYKALKHPLAAVLDGMKGDCRA